MAAIPGVAHRDAMAPRVVRLVVVGLELGGDRVEAGNSRLLVAKTGARRHHVEDLDDLGPQTSGELGAPPDGVLARHPTLFVGRGAERQVRQAHQAMVGRDAVSGGEDTLEVGAHAPVHTESPADAELGPRGGCQRRVRTYADDHQHHVGQGRHFGPRGLDSVDLEAASRTLGVLGEPA